MFFKKKPKVTTQKIPEKFWVALFYDGAFEPSKDNSLLSFDFQVDEDSENEEKFKEILSEFISDVCKDYPTAIVVKNCSAPPQEEFNSVKIGKGADILSLKSYYDAFAFSAD
ncbi:MAG: hypothetical protein LKJ75_03995 [Clostridia bacterium]|jgi:hypothetical protein|nr:hypothetical protein [Clostridia bacterium]MCI2014345.1 hypothetical protein [Clostridia bacterium]